MTYRDRNESIGEIELTLQAKGRTPVHANRKGRHTRIACASWMAASLVVSSGVVRAEPTDIPAAMALPAHQVLVAHALGVGVQIYTCAPMKNDPMLFSWVFNSPEATLFANDGHRIGSHYGGPTWEAKDGSKIVGTVKAQADSPSKSAIPWLMLQARPVVSEGVLGPVRYVLRMHTVGGVAPAMPCNSISAGRVARVPYSADYYFYGPETAR